MSAEKCLIKTSLVLFSIITGQFLFILPFIIFETFHGGKDFIINSSFVGSFQQRLQKAAAAAAAETQTRST
jgi:hypothetical protein